MIPKEAAIVDPGGDVETLIAEIEQRQLKLTSAINSWPL